MYRSRLEKGADKKTASFLSSITEDERIIEEDIDGTEAHDIMLYENKIINRQELREILRSLEKIRSEWKRGSLKISPSYEDIHEFIEERTVRDTGLSIGGKLHTARSRNDQVVVDLRMKLRNEINEISAKLLSLVETTLAQGRKNMDTDMVLYTHSQHAQIGTLGHYLLAYCDIFIRDYNRLEDTYRRLNQSPLGAAAIAGTSFKIDRDRTASLLGFDGLVENSIDAISSRDFALEIVGSLAILMSNMSRFAEDLILWSSSEFGYVEVADEFASSSSVLPQKKNADTLELVRGGSGSTYGALMNLLTIVKGLTTGYSRDLQKVKAPLWTSVDTVKNSLEIMKAVTQTLRINKQRLSKVANESYALAVDLAEALVQRHGLSFREAHKVVGEVARVASTSGLKPSGITSKMIRQASIKVLGRPLTVTDRFVRSHLGAKSSLRQKKSLGSPARKEVLIMAKRLTRMIKELKRALDHRVKKIQSAQNELRNIVKSAIATRVR